MVQLTFMEEVKDKASRLIPTAYMEIVEEATAPHLSIPVYEHAMFLCDSANSKPDAVDDIVRALRRRITNDNPAVKHLLVLLLDAMMKNCGSSFHAEVCSQKGILRDLVNLATDPPTSARGMQAKEAALTLVLNLSVWFAGHPDTACHLLTTLANDVRSVLGPNAFEGIRPDTNTHVRTTVKLAMQPQQRRSSRPHGHKTDKAARGRSKDQHNYVDAILIDLPTEETLAAMLDSCVAFSEYLNNALVTPEGDIVHDDVVAGFATRIEKDHDYVTILLSSNLQVDRDVLRSVSDSQSSVLTRLHTKQKPCGVGDEGRAGNGNATPPMPLPQAAVYGEPADPIAPPPYAAVASGATPPKAVVPTASPENSPAADKPPAPPTMDDLFGSAPPPPPPLADDAAPLATPEDTSAAPPPADPPAEEEAQSDHSPPPYSLPAEAPAEVPHREEAAAPPPANDDDDFDAFLAGQLKK